MPFVELLEHTPDAIVPAVLCAVAWHGVAAVRLGGDYRLGCGIDEFLPDRVDVIAFVGKQGRRSSR